MSVSPVKATFKDDLVFEMLISLVFCVTCHMLPQVTIRVSILFSYAAVADVFNGAWLWVKMGSSAYVFALEIKCKR